MQIRDVTFPLQREVTTSAGDFLMWSRILHSNLSDFLLSVGLFYLFFSLPVNGSFLIREETGRRLLDGLQVWAHSSAPCPSFTWSADWSVSTVYALRVSVSLRDVVLKLLQFEASTNVSDSKGCFPLHLAAWRGDVAIVRILIHHGPSHCRVNQQVRPHRSSSCQKPYIYPLLPLPR